MKDKNKEKDRNIPDSEEEISAPKEDVGIKKTASAPILTPEEMGIYQRVKSDDADWKTITEESVDDYSLTEDPFKLPDEVKKYVTSKKFSFRWIERKSSRLDEVRSAQVPNRWWIVNAESFPDLKHLCDPVLGCISRHDQMLVFKPWWMKEKRAAMMAEINDAQDRSGTIEGKDGEAYSGAQFTAGKKSPDNPTPLRGQIKSGDTIEYEETGRENHDFGDLITT